MMGKRGLCTFSIKFCYQAAGSFLTTQLVFLLLIGEPISLLLLGFSEVDLKTSCNLSIQGRRLSCSLKTEGRAQGSPPSSTVPLNAQRLCRPQFSAQILVLTSLGPSLQGAQLKMFSSAKLLRRRPSNVEFCSYLCPLSVKWGQKFLSSFQ